jgi:hypothetical protein
MLGPAENHAVLCHIANEARRPKISIRLWGAMLCRLTERGGIQMTRREMMAAAGTQTTGHISNALRELETWGALIRAERGAPIQWFLNPRIANRLPREERPAAFTAAPPLLTVLDGRKDA